MKKDDEPISGILDRAPKVVDAFGGAGGFFVMLWALWVARRRGGWILALTAVLGGASARWFGYL